MSILGRKNKAVSEPATPAACHADYQAANTPERKADAREQRAHAQISGNAAGGRWRGRRTG